VIGCLAGVHCSTLLESHAALDVAEHKPQNAHFNLFPGSLNAGSYTSGLAHLVDKMRYVLYGKHRRTTIDASASAHHHISAFISALEGRAHQHVQVSICAGCARMVQCVKVFTAHV